MAASLAFFAQAGVTGEGPYRNLQDHLADPLRENLLFTLLYKI
jgi:hypothetical protein